MVQNLNRNIERQDVAIAVAGRDPKGLIDLSEKVLLHHYMVYGKHEVGGADRAS